MSMNQAQLFDLTRPGPRLFGSSFSRPNAVFDRLDKTHKPVNGCGLDGNRALTIAVDSRLALPLSTTSNTAPSPIFAAAASAT